MSTYAETAARLEAARAAGVAEVTIELDSGVFTVPVAEAIETFEEIEPGEAFEIVAVDGARMNTIEITELAHDVAAATGYPIDAVARTLRLIIEFSTDSAEVRDVFAANDRERFVSESQTVTNAILPAMLLIREEIPAVCDAMIAHLER